MENDEQNAILALLSLQYGIPCEVTKIHAEERPNSLASFPIYNGHVNVFPLPLASINSSSLKTEESLLLPSKICMPVLLPPQTKSFSKLSVESISTMPISREKKTTTCEERSKRRRRGNLPKEAVRVMTDWLKSNRYNAYPSEEDKHKMATSLNIKHKQVSNWFINARRRKLTQILNKEGKDSKDYRITRKKKGVNHDESRPGSETEVSATTYPSPTSSTSSASDGHFHVSARKQYVHQGNNHRHGRLTAMPPTPCSLTSFEGNTSTEDEGDTDFVTFQQRNLEEDVRTLHFESL